MPITKLNVPPTKDREETRARSTLWLDPVTANVFRDLVRYTNSDSSALLDRMIHFYVAKHHPEVEIELADASVPTPPPRKRGRPRIRGVS